ncbi:MAG: acyltransferase [Pseudomonadota bacterium]
MKRAEPIARLDTLRALAVTVVVVFHVAPEALPWGFIGVDMFFSLSGFLMLYLFLHEAEADDFMGRLEKAKSFVARRFWRIYPPLIITLFFTLVCGLILFSSSHLYDAANSAVRAMVFIPNWFFYSQAGYFDTDSVFKPLLHTWSLGVEEQFYIVFAVCIALFSKRVFVIVVALTAVLSLGAWSYLTAANAVGGFSSALLPTVPDEPLSALFFLPQYRAFQFTIGALAAYAYVRGMRLGAWSQYAGFAGLALAAWLGSDAEIAHISAPMVTIAMVLLMMRSDLCDRSAKIGIVQSTARVSYQLYLTHWPIIVFWQYITFEPLGVFGMVMCLALSVVTALALYRFTDPMRKAWTGSTSSQHGSLARQS